MLAEDGKDDRVGLLCRFGPVNPNAVAHAVTLELFEKLRQPRDRACTEGRSESAQLPPLDWIGEDRSAFGHEAVHRTPEVRAQLRIAEGSDGLRAKGGRALNAHGCVPREIWQCASAGRSLLGPR